MNRFTELLGNKWDLGKEQSKATNNICAWIYAFELLALKKEFFTLEVNGKSVGFTGYRFYDQRKTFLSFCYAKIAVLLSLLPCIKSRKGLKEYKDSYSEITPKSVKSSHNAELLMIIVDPKEQGKGYGHQLINYVKNRIKEIDPADLYLETDDSCQLSFYEKQGCKVVTKVPVYQDGVLKENAYLLKVPYSKEAICKR